MQNGSYVLEVSPLFGEPDRSGREETTIRSDEKNALSEEPELSAEDQATENGFSKEELSSAEIEKEKVTDLYGKEEKKATSAVYQAKDNTFQLEYIPFENGVKENLILNKKPDSSVWQFRLSLSEGMTARKNTAGEGISFYARDQKDEEILVGGIQTPYMNDATGKHLSEAITYDLKETGDSAWLLTMTVDPDYLKDPETVYPVTIDPSYSWSGGSAVYDVYVLSKSTYADMNFYNSTTTGMFAGKTNANGCERTYISFDGLAGKIKEKSVVSAKLVVYESGGGTSGETVQAHAVKAAWNKSTLTWNNRPGYNATALSSFTNNATANHKGTLDITSYARSVAKGSADYGIMLRTKDEAVSKYAKLYGSRHSSASYRPKLTVTYIERPTEASSVTLASRWMKKNAALKVTWAGIESTALKGIQYRIASMSDDGKQYVNEQLVPYNSNPAIGKTSSGTASVSTSSLGEGCFRFYVRGQDQYGTTGTGKGVTFVLDGTAPTLSQASISPATSASSYSNQAPTITWSNAADKYLKQVQYSLDGGSYASMGTTASGSFTIPEEKISTTGKHTIKVRAVDKSGNTSTAKTLIYYYDNVKPTGKITITDDEEQTGKYRIAFTASDGASGVKSVVLKLSGGALTSDVTLYSGAAASSVSFDPSAYAEGTYTLTLTITDKAGNTASVKKTFRPVVISEWTPDNLTVQDKINYKTVLKWDRRVEDELPDGISYEVYRSTSKNFTPNSTTLAASGVRAFYWCEPNVDYGSTYYYKVRAVRTNSGGTIIASSDYSREVSSTVLSADEYNKRLGIKEYWGYQSFDNPVGNGQVEKSRGNFVYQQEDVILPSSELDFGITRTYNSLSSAKTAFGNGWDHNFNLEILRICASNGRETDSYVYKDGSGTIEHLEKQSDGSYVSGGTKELHLYESTGTDGEILELEEGPEISWNYRMEDKAQTNWYFNSSGQAIAVTEPAGTWMVLHYDEKQGMLSRVEASTGKELAFTYQDAAQGDHLLVQTITLPDESSLNYAYSGEYLTSMTRKSADGSQSITYRYSWNAGKVSTVYDAENHAYGLAYDSSGRVQTLTLPDGEKTVLTYNNTAKKTTITKKTSSGSVILTETVSWNDAGNIVSYVDALGQETCYTYEDNRLTSTSEKAGWETIENGKVVVHTGTRTSSTEYDSQGNIVKDTDEDGTVTTYTYGDSTNPNQVTREAVTKSGTLLSDMRYLYDQIGRILEKRNAITNRSTQYTYTSTTGNSDSSAGGVQVSVLEKEGSQKLSSSKGIYDAEGNLLTQEEESGGIQTSCENRYDTMGNILESSYSDGSRTVYTYDFMGRNIKQQEYDQEGNLVETQETIYGPNGQIKKETAADGKITAYTYDSRNRVLSTTITAGGNSRSSSTAYGYETVSIKNGQGSKTVTIQNAEKVTQTDAAGTQSVSWSNGCGQTVRTTTNGINTDTLYDVSGQEYANIVSTKSDGNIISINLLIYDQNGYQTDTIVQPGTNGGSFILTDSSIRTSQSYDEKGQITCTVDELGNQTRYTYDDSGRILSVKQGTETTSYQYSTDTDGNSRTVVTRANGSTSTSLEDSAGRVLYTQDSGSGKNIRVTSTYDEDGMLIGQTQADDSQISYTYDSQGRLSETVYRDSAGTIVHATAYTYDQAGRVTAMVDQAGKNGALTPLRYTGYAYNAFGELSQSFEVDNTEDPDATEKAARQITYAYGADGICTSVSYADSENGVQKLHYHYNSLKQLTKITADLTDGRNRMVSEYSYTADGKISSRKDYEDFAGNGNQYIQRHYTYDAFDRVLTMQYNESGNSAATEESHTYAYDKASRIIHEESSSHWNGQETAVQEEKDYSYDAKGQLVKSILLDQNQVRTTTDYSYDTVGNRLKMTQTRFDQRENQQLSKEETSYTYNGLDQMLTSRVRTTTGTSSPVDTSSVSYTYDANGNLTRAVDSIKEEETVYQYDLQGQMTSCQIKQDGNILLDQQNAYNGDGQRIYQKEGSEETSYYYQNGTLLASRDGEDRLKEFYYLGNSQNPLALMSKTSNGTTAYYFYNKDMQGSTRTVTANTGSCAAWYTYTDFGETTVHEEQTGFQQAICYTGGIYDEGTDLYYLNARHYDPETGRFFSRDTYRGESDTPSTLHLYLYCANDPVNYVDPSGHWVETALDVACAGWSLAEFAAMPSWASLGYLLWDVGAVCVPFIPGSYVVKGTKWIRKSAKAKPVEMVAKVSIKLPDKVEDLNRGKNYMVIGKYKGLRKIFKGRGNKFEIHHIIEKRFKAVIKLNINDYPSIALEKKLHRIITNRWLKAIPKKTKQPSKQQLINAAKKVYRDMPELRKISLTMIHKYYK